MSERWRIILSNGEVFEADDKHAVIVAGLSTALLVEAFEVREIPWGRWRQAIASQEELEAARAAIDAEET